MTPREILKGGVQFTADSEHCQQTVDGQCQCMKRFSRNIISLFCPPGIGRYVK